jgi:hypothetical protein
MEKRNCFVFGHRGSLHGAWDFIKAWHWLAQAVRKPITEQEEQELSISGVVYVLDPDEEGTPLSLLNGAQNVINVRGRLTTAISTNIRPSCWRQLFEFGTLLICESTQGHSFGQGFKTSFDLLLSLAAIDFCCTVDGGVVFVGYQTLIYPTVIENDYAQFHLLTSDEGQIYPFTIKYKNRHLDKGWEQLKTKPCFFGLVHQVSHQSRH